MDDKHTFKELTMRYGISITMRYEPLVDVFIFKALDGYTKRCYAISVNPYELEQAGLDTETYVANMIHEGLHLYLDPYERKVSFLKDEI